jgi:hypothetical protein
MKRILTSFLFVLVCVFSGLAKDWCGIVPLHSNRADVERLLKVQPERCGGNSCLYDLKDKTVFAIYSADQTCRNDDISNSWNVARDTVIEITVRFKTPQPFSVLGADLTKYERTPDKEFPALIYFTNETEGVEIETSGDSIRRITFYPAAKDDQLRCPAKPKAL